MAKFAKYAQEVDQQGQTNIFSSFEEEGLNDLQTFSLKKIPSASLMERLNREKEYLGMYVSSHPLKGLRKYLSKKINLIESITKKDISRTVKLGGLLAKAKKVFTKSGAYMLYGELEDPTGRIEIVVFPKVYNQYQDIFVEGNVVILEGRLDLRSQALQFSCNAGKAISLESMIKNAQAAGVYDAKEKMNRKPKIIEFETNKPIYENTDIPQESPPPELTEEWKENPYIIRLPSSIGMDRLNKLKQILLSNQGERKVEIHLENNQEVKRIKVPFGIHVSTELEKMVQEAIS